MINETRDIISHKVQPLITGKMIPKDAQKDKIMYFDRLLHRWRYTSCKIANNQVYIPTSVADTWVIIGMLKKR